MSQPLAGGKRCCQQRQRRSPKSDRFSCERVEGGVASAAMALRCHLLIGQPASGKTTLAKALAPLLTAPGEPPAQVLSTDAIRATGFEPAT